MTLRSLLTAVVALCVLVSGAAPVLAAGMGGDPVEQSQATPGADGSENATSTSTQTPTPTATPAQTSTATATGTQTQTSTSARTATATPTSTEGSAGTSTPSDGSSAQGATATGAPTRSGGSSSAQGATADTDAEGRPDFTASVAEGRVRAGETTALQVTLTNTGRITDGASNPQVEREVTTARAVTARLEAEDAPLTVRTGTVSLGTLPDGTTTQVPFQVHVDENAEPGTYELDVVVEYRYTGEYNASDGDRETDTRTERMTVEVEVTESADFEVVNVTSNVSVGGSGNVTYTLRNTGSEDIERAAVTLDSPNAALNFGGAQSARVFVGDWAAGATKRVTVEATAAPNAERRPYAVDLTVDYTTDDGEQARSNPLTTGVTLGDEQNFDVADANVSLRVGEDGTIEGTLVNRGPNAAENAVLVLQSSSRSLDVSETEYAIGTLRPGEGAQFSYDVAVADGAGAAPRQFTVQVRYEGSDGTTKQSDPLYVRGDVGPARDEFAVEPVNTSVEAGGTAQVTLRVTNNGDERLTDISAQLFGDDPVSVDDGEAFVGELAPGESTTLEFRISAAGGAIGKTYPVSVDFQYDDADGDTLLSDTYRVPVEVAASEDGGLLQVGWLPVGLLTLLMLGVGYVVVSRR